MTLENPVESSVPTGALAQMSNYPRDLTERFPENRDAILSDD